MSAAALADTQARLARLEAELALLQAEHAIRACMERYMALCDTLDAHTPLVELAGLFTADAVWEGRGAKYSNSFGAYRGREAIAEMFSRYMREPAHFALNVHFLCSEAIAVNAGATRAEARWVMLQTSTFASGASHLNAARLQVDMALDADNSTVGTWRIAHLRTENLFSRPVDTWNDSAPLPVPKA